MSIKSILAGILAALLLTVLFTPLILFLRTRISNTILHPQAAPVANAADTQTPVEEIIASTSTAAPEPTAMPFEILAWDEQRDSGLLPLTRFSECLQQAPPWGCTHYEVEFPARQGAVLTSGWCAQDQATLESNLNDMHLSLVVDGIDIPLETITRSEEVQNEMACELHRTTLTGWSLGEHHVCWTRSFSQDVHDGYDLYTAGSYFSDFQITVVEKSIAELEYQYGPQTGPQVELLPGNALEFTQPPGKTAFANDEFSPAPEGFQLAPFCLNSCFRYNQWLGMTMPGESYEVIFTEPASTLGLQFWGDVGDGFASVYVDGALLWEGDTEGSDNQYPGGAFVNYLQVSGLQPVANHILRVETGPDGGGVTIYFFGTGKTSH